MDEFVIEKYIEISIGICTGMLIQIFTLTVLQYNRKLIGSRFIYL